MHGMNLTAAGLAAALLITAGSAIPGADKADREAIEKLQSEVVVLERQIRNLQESIDRSNGQTTTLITQVSDSVSVATREISRIQSVLADTQVKVTGGLSGFDARFLAVDSALRSINERLGRTLDQVTSLREALSTSEAARRSMDPTDPVQLFSAAYGDYLKGNFELAVDQFRQYLTRFPALEGADDAQYWIGESLQSQGKSQEALNEFQSLIEKYPHGDRAVAAKLKRGLILLQLNQTDAGVAELRELIGAQPESPEAVTAKQQLEQLGVPVKAPRETRSTGPGRTRKRTTKP